MIKESQGIFIAGIPNAGKTVIGNCLDKHPNYAFADFRAKFIGDPAFNLFPERLIQWPQNQREEIIEVFKRLCLTRFYCYYRDAFIDKKFVRIWQWLDRRWQSRFKYPRPMPLLKPISRSLDLLWLDKNIQSRVKGVRHRRQVPRKPSGLNVRLDYAEVKKSLIELDDLIHVQTSEEAYRVLGFWWDSLFSCFAARSGKKRWIDERPSYMKYGVFLNQCFSNVKIIHMVRHLREAARVSSAENRRLSAKYGIELGHSSTENGWKKWVDHRAEYYKRVLDVQKMVPSDCFLNVKFEELMTSPEKTLRMVSSFLDVDYDSAMLDGLKFKKRADDDRSPLTPEMDEYCSQSHAGLMAEWGYSS